MDDLVTSEVYQRILIAGGGEVQQATLHEAIRAGFDWDRLTHMITDPWILESGDPRYREFQEWLKYDIGKVAEQKKSSACSNGAGGTWKIFYTFLFYKLTYFHRTIEEVEFDISLKKIKKEARARARLRRQIKVKEETEEAEAELIILKENIVKRNPGRFYLDKSKGGEVLWSTKSEQKRKAEWDEDFSSKGSSQGKRAKNSPGWS